MNVQLLISIGITVMLLLAFGVIFFVMLYQRRVIAHQVELKKINEQKELELLQASIQSEEQERMRIAAELHDDVGATLASARLFLYKDKGAAFNENIINQSKVLLDESINKIRNISHKLQPATLQHLGLELSLQSLIETLNKSGNIKAGHIKKCMLPRATDNAELAAYRISQEIIANILKHAGATTIVLETDANAEGIRILFSHDGVGLTQESYEEQIYKKGSTGLKNIVNRLKSINGAIQFYTNDEVWYKTLLIIPLDATGKPQ
jgi:signal transduction histidine kinase